MTNEERFEVGIEVLGRLDLIWAKIFDDRTPWELTAAFIANKPPATATLDHAQKMSIDLQNAIGILGVTKGYLIACQHLLTVVSSMQNWEKDQILSRLKRIDQYDRS